MEAANAETKVESWADVCRIDDLIDNIGVCALIDGQQIAVFRLSGSNKLFAIDNHDPFSNANVLSRGVVGDLNGQPVVAAPIFKQHFNLRTGQCLEDESVRLQVYPVRVDHNMVQIAHT